MILRACLIHALPLDQRRVLNRREAASYLGVSPGHFDKLVKDGMMPEPLPDYGRVRRWDKACLDRTLDHASGLAAKLTPIPNAYDQWKAENGQG